MTAAVFDTLKLATKLEESGFTPSQAKGAATALAEVFNDDLVTKAYLDTRLEMTKTYLDTRLEVTKTYLEARLDARLEATKSKILKWMFGQTLVIIGAVLALSRFSH